MMTSSFRNVVRVFCQLPRRRRATRQCCGYFSVQTLELRILLDGDPYDEPPAAVDDYFFAGDYNQASDFADSVAGNDISESGDVFSVVDEPTHGTLNMAPDGSFTYTPDGSYVGIVEFRYQIDDGVNPPSEPATVQLELYNPPPMANDDGPYYSLDQGTMTISAQYGLLVNDDKDSRETNTASLDEPPLHGSATVSSDGGFTYTPDPEYQGDVSFKYKIEDGVGGYSVATVFLQVKKVTITKESYEGSDIWIGEKVSLLADNIDGVTNPTFSWSVSGDAIKNYVTDYYTTPTGVQQPRAYKVPLEAADKTASSIGFYWVSSGSKTASVTVSANGQTSTAQVEYNVQTPEFTFWAQVGDIYKYGGPAGVIVALGKQTAVTRIDGITFNIPNPAIGDFDLLQMASLTATRTLADGTNQRLSASGVDPDHVYLYDHDIVAMKLNPNARSYNVNYEFETYLKWKGPRDGIYVPLSKIEWSFGWSTTSTNGTSWTDPVKSGTLDRRIDGVNGVYFPEYDRNIQYDAGGLTADNDWGGWEQDD